MDIFLNQSFLVQLVLWLFLLLTYFGLTNFVLNRYKITYTSKIEWFILFSLLYIVTVLLLWKDLITVYLPFTFLTALALIGNMAGLILIGILAYSYYRQTKLFKPATSKTIFALSLRKEYLVTKSFDIFFQELLILVLFTFVAERITSVWTQALVLASIFGGAHIAILIVFKEIKKSLYLILGAILFGFAIPLIYTLGSRSFFVAYAIQYAAYIFVAPFIYVLANRAGILVEL